MKMPTRITKRDLIFSAAIIILAFLLYKSCSSSATPQHQQDKQTIDSLETQVLYTEHIAQKKIDSLYQLNETKDSIISEQSQQKIIAQVKAKEAAKRADWFAFQYQQAKKFADTPLIIASCDSLATEYEVFKTETDKTIAAADSIITTQQQKITNQDTIINTQAELNAEMRSAFFTTTEKCDQLYSSYTKLNRKNKNNWIKQALAFIAGAAITSQLKK